MNTDASAAERFDFERAFAENAPFVWRALRRLGVREADVEDICQEVFLVVHRRRASFDGQSAMRTWLYGICLRVASEYRRRPHRRREEVTAEPPDTGLADGPHEALERRRALDQLDAALDQLDDAKRAVFVLYEIEQIPMTEVAAVVGVPLQTAYSRLYAARKVVRAALSAPAPAASARNGAGEAWERSGP